MCARAMIMSVKKTMNLFKVLEDDRCPLLGPNLKGLLTFGLLYGENKFRNNCFTLLHIVSIIFVATQVIELFFLRHNLVEALLNISVTALSIVSVTKTMSVHLWGSKWKKLVKDISAEEIDSLIKQDQQTLKIMDVYKTYSRVVTYLYWGLVIMTTTILISTPLLKFLFLSDYRQNIKSGKEPLPQILSSWFPFDKTKMPGYVLASAVHLTMSIQGAGVIAVYDSNVVAILTFLKGQLIILKENCRRMFDDENLHTELILQRIKECHRHHNYLIRQHKEFNSLLSPVMFTYLLVCSITICCSVVQLALGEAIMSQKVWLVEYTSGLIAQLFLYCWHSNEVTFESLALDRGVYESKWWRSNGRTRRQLVLLGGKLDKPLYINAGPFSTLSVPTFIDVSFSSSATAPYFKYRNVSQDDKILRSLF